MPGCNNSSIIGWLPAITPKIKAIIKESKKLGYVVILCSKDDCVGRTFADEFYFCDIKDKEKVLEIAKKEKINGIISNSEFAMASVAYVANKLGLKGTTINSVEILQNKYLFRQKQNELGLYCPKSILIKSVNKLIKECLNIKFPIIIKPCKSCASRGVSKIDYFNEDIIKESYYNALKNARTKEVLLEEYVEKTTLPVIECDVFVNNGKFLWLGMETDSYPIRSHIIPPGSCRPAQITKEQELLFKKETKRILKSINANFGQFDVESFIIPNGNLFLVEINARQAGSTFQHDIYFTSGINSSRLLVSSCVEDDRYFNYCYKRKKTIKPLLTTELYSNKEGKFKGIYIDEKIRPYLLKIDQYVDYGRCVEKVKNMQETLASVSFTFDNEEKLVFFNNQVEELVYPIIE